MLRKGSDGPTLKFHLCDTVLGCVGLVVSTRGLRVATLPHLTRDEALREVTELGALEPASAADLGQLPLIVRALAEGQRASQEATIDWDGLSPFRRAVLEETLRIPAGETRSYG